MRVLELTGDSTPDAGTLNRADLLIVTPEKWDSISRGWQKRYECDALLLLSLYHNSYLFISMLILSLTCLLLLRLRVCIGSMFRRWSWSS